MPQLPGEPACPYCGSANDGYMSASGKHIHPRDGDISICATCASFGIFEKRGPLFLFSIREPTLNELEELRANPEAMAAQRIIKTRIMS